MVKEVKNMRKHFLYFFVCLLLSLVFLGCKNDEQQIKNDIQEITTEELKHESKKTIINNPSGYTLTYNTDYFEMKEFNNNDESLLFLNCIVDPDYKLQNYIKIKCEDNPYQKVYQNLIEINQDENGFFTDEMIFGEQKIDSKIISFYKYDDFILTTYVIPSISFNKTYIIEIGMHNYNDENEEEVNYKINDTISQVTNSIVFR